MESRQLYSCSLPVRQSQRKVLEWLLPLPLVLQSPRKPARCSSSVVLSRKDRL